MTNILNNVTVETGYAPGSVINTDGSVTSSKNAASTSNLGQDDFLKLLVAELKYQSPDKPADTSQMMAQEAAFSQLNAITEMAKSINTLINSSQSTQAAAMIGKSIVGTNVLTNAPVTGLVTGTKLGKDGPTLLIGNTEVAFSSVTEVDAPPTAP